MASRVSREDEEKTQEDDLFNFKFRFEKIFAGYVVPCAHSAGILYIMAAATMRVPTSIYTIAIMAFVVCDLLAWAGTTLGLLLCAPSFFETLLQERMVTKLCVWKGISMIFEILILFMLVLVEIVKKEHVIDCICVCAAVFLFSGVLGVIFIKHFNTTLEKIAREKEAKEPREKRVVYGVPSVGGSGYQGNISQNDTDLTHPSVPEFIDFDGPSSNPIAPFAPPNSRTRPIEARQKKNNVPYKNEGLLREANSPYVMPENKSRFSSTGNEIPPTHLVVAPVAPDLMSGSPPNAGAPLYTQNGKEARRVPSAPHPLSDQNDRRSPPAISSIESDFHQQHLNNSQLNSDFCYRSIGVSHPVPPPILAFPPPETSSRAPFDHVSDDFIHEGSSYNNH